ncbi:cytochrome P450 [Artemisia annua]|uniref:Cytochrome P450 n=1 Tax=Artemisia annua TaxID=35608 RepID=A0A2U1KR88_ARTAN|nr:cytochrome P450 [Artemisia annua]
MAVSRYVAYDHAGFGLAPYGLYWQQKRKLFTSELFMSQRLEKLKIVCNSEVKSIINELLFLSLKDGDKMSTMDMNKLFEHVTFNINIRIMLFGKRRYSFEGMKEAAEVKEAIKKGFIHRKNLVSYILR